MESSQSHPARLLGPGGCPKTKVNKKQPPPCPPPRIQEQLLSERPPLPPTHSAIQSKKKFPDPPSFVDRVSWGLGGGRGGEGMGEKGEWGKRRSKSNNRFFFIFV